MTPAYALGLLFTFVKLDISPVAFKKGIFKGLNVHLEISFMYIRLNFEIEIIFSSAVGM